MTVYCGRCKKHIGEIFPYDREGLIPDICHECKKIMVQEVLVEEREREKTPQEFRW